MIGTYKSEAIRSMIREYEGYFRKELLSKENLSKPVDLSVLSLSLTGEMQILFKFSLSSSSSCCFLSYPQNGS